MPLEQFKTQVLLLHSQQSTLDRLSAGFTDKYSVHCATSGTEALHTLGETPIHVIVSAQKLPGMSGLEALREAKKRSPDTIGILLAGTDKQDGLEALVGAQEVFQIVRGEITPAALISLIESANKRVRLLALAESANDHKANVDEPVGEHIVMETSENGAVIISDGTGTLPTLKSSTFALGPGVGGREVDVLVLTKDEEFLGTIKDSSRGLHNVFHATTPVQAEVFVQKHKIGVLVTDAAMVGSNIEVITKKLRKNRPRIVAIVAGRRDDGELLMDLINRGHVYRFLLKPVSPGRARLAIEASVKHHMEAPEEAFKPKPGGPIRDPQAEARAKAKADAEAKARAKAKAEADAAAKAKAAQAARVAKAEAEAKARAEAEERAKAEAKAKEEADARAKEEAAARAAAEAKAREEAAAKAKSEAEARKKAEAEAKAKAEAEAREKEEARARAKADEEARQKAAAAKAAADAKLKAEEEARAQAAAEAKRKADAEKKAREEAAAAARAEEKARADAEAKARKEQKAREKAEAKAKKKAAARERKEAAALAKAEAAAVTAAAAASGKDRTWEHGDRIEPRIFDEPESDLDDAFGEDQSFVDTMTGFAASVSSSFTAVRDIPGGGELDLSLTDDPSLFSRLNAKTLTIGASATAVIAAIAWFALSGGAETQKRVITPSVASSAGSQLAVPTGSAAGSEVSAEPLPLAEIDLSAVSWAEDLNAARAAHDAGNLIAPAGDNAVERYLSVISLSGGDERVVAEMTAVVNDVLGLAEDAILARAAGDAETALQMVRLADPGNARLTFLGAQLNELQLRERTAEARIAIRERRFEDAGRLVAEARSVAGPDSVDVELLADELATARNQQEIGATITIANERLAVGSLVTPANDNARYYFELVLATEPDNQAARQGLNTVASRLVLQAREAIDIGRFDQAEGLLTNARRLDPASSDLSASSAALINARNALNDRQAEALRQQDAEKAAVAQREAAIARREAASRETTAPAEPASPAGTSTTVAAKTAPTPAPKLSPEVARQRSEQEAGQIATASPLGVGAAAPARPSPTPAAVRNAAPEIQQQTNTAPVPSPVASTSPPVTGAATFGTADRPPAAAAEAPAVAAVTTPPATRKPEVQRQSANAVNVASATPAPAPAAQNREPELVAISDLSRVNYVGPEYPRTARRRNVTGAVELMFTVSISGEVSNVEVLRSEPGDTFDEAAMTAVQQWRFEPVIENGSPVEKRSAVRLAFDLE